MSRIEQSALVRLALSDPLRVAVGKDGHEALTPGSPASGHAGRETASSAAATTPSSAQMSPGHSARFGFDQLVLVEIGQRLLQRHPLAVTHEGPNGEKRTLA